MSKHTPGPWAWDDEVPTDYLQADWSEIAPWLCDESGEAVLEGQIACQNPANARLIAAAPELLDALKDARSALRYIREAHGELYGVGFDRVETNSTAAIAKAEGAQ